MSRREGFTLIELLVVIAVIALLLGILMPVLARVRKQARAVGCQANLRQWGILFAGQGAMSEERSIFPVRTDPSGNRHEDWTSWARELEQICGANVRDSLLCPAASRTDKREAAKAAGWSGALGGTFSAWWRGPSAKEPNRPELLGSYTINSLALGKRVSINNPHWESIHVREAAAIPLWFDGAWFSDTMLFDTESPPAYEGSPEHISQLCMNRHEGGLNYLFLDWSVRKVGLKELWTLRWGATFNPAGPWTKAGGVKSEDWPEWMRKFKDY